MRSVWQPPAELADLVDEINYQNQHKRGTRVFRWCQTPRITSVPRITCLSQTSEKLSSEDQPISRSVADSARYCTSRCSDSVTEKERLLMSHVVGWIEV